MTLQDIEQASEAEPMSEDLEGSGTAAASMAALPSAAGSDSDEDPEAARAALLRQARAAVKPLGGRGRSPHRRVQEKEGPPQSCCKRHRHKVQCVMHVPPSNASAPAPGEEGDNEGEDADGKAKKRRKRQKTSKAAPKKEGDDDGEAADDKAKRRWKRQGVQAEGRLPRVLGEGPPASP